MQHHFTLAVVLTVTAFLQQLAAFSPQQDIVSPQPSLPQQSFFATVLALAKQQGWGGLQQGASGAQHEAVMLRAGTGAAAPRVDRFRARANAATAQVIRIVRMESSPQIEWLNGTNRKTRATVGGRTIRRGEHVSQQRQTHNRQ
jgi:hypothetical protein